MILKSERKRSFERSDLQVELTQGRTAGRRGKLAGVQAERDNGLGADQALAELRATAIQLGLDPKLVGSTDDLHTLYGHVLDEYCLFLQGKRVTFAEAVEAAGVDPSRARLYWLALGHPIPNDEELLTPGDVATLRFFDQASSYAGIDEALYAAAVIGSAVAELSQVLVISATYAMEQPTSLGPSRRAAVAKLYTELASVLMPQCEEVMRAAYRRHSAANTPLDWPPEEEPSVPQPRAVCALAFETKKPTALPMATGFAGEFAELVSHLLAVADGSQGELVKAQQGSALFTAATPAEGLHIATDLCASSLLRGSGPRAGIAWGHVSRRRADVYGPTVMAAARLSRKAAAGEILASGEFASALGQAPGVQIESTGEDLPRGLSGPTPIIRVVV